MPGQLLQHKILLHIADNGGSIEVGKLINAFGDIAPGVSGTLISMWAKGQITRRYEGTRGYYELTALGESIVTNTRLAMAGESVPAVYIIYKLLDGTFMRICHSPDEWQHFAAMYENGSTPVAVYQRGGDGYEYRVYSTRKEIS